MPPRICFVIVQDTYNFYRTFLPASELAKRGFDVSLIRDPDLNTLLSFDAVVFETPFSARHERLFRKLKGKVRLVVDLDDNYHRLDPSNPNYGTITNARAIIDRVIEMADELLVSTEPLREFYADRSERISVIPNMLPEELFIKPSPRSAQAALRIGWHGGFSHDQDLRILEAVVPAVHKEFPDVRFIFFGNAPRMKLPNAEYVESVPFAAFPATLARLHLDIGLAPLVDTPFNRCKTNLKWLEFSALAVPTIASDVEPYSRCIQHGVDGFLAKTSEDMVRELGRLIRDPDLRRSVGDRARETAVERHGRGVLGDRYAELASRWKAHADPHPSFAGENWSGDVLMAMLLCTPAAMVPLLITLPGLRHPDVSSMAVFLFAGASSLVLSAATILASVGVCIRIHRTAPPAPRPSSDAEQGLANFLNYHRRWANLHRLGSRTLVSAGVVSSFGLLPLAVIHAQSEPWTPLVLFCTALPEAGILAFAFCWVYSKISSSLPPPAVRPLEAFIATEASSARSSMTVAPAEREDRRRVLNVGACSKDIPMPAHFDGWEKVYLDAVPGPGVDIVADARDMPSIAGESFDAVYFSHCLEHFDPWEANRVLKELARVLKSGGFLEVHVPNILEVCRQVAAGQPIDAALYNSAAGPIAPLDMIYGYSRFVLSGNDLMRHKTAFTPDSLTAVLEGAGFHVDSMDGARGFELSAVARKSP